MATHKELITSGKFDEKFKRALLDYYSYGFKNLDSFDKKKQQTVSEDWFRLTRVVADYMEWSKDEERKQVMFVSADAQSMKENPFHKIYHFCKYKPLVYPAYFLHAVAALSNQFSLREEDDSYVNNYLNHTIDELKLSDKLKGQIETNRDDSLVLKEIINSIKFDEETQKKINVAIRRHYKTSELIDKYLYQLVVSSDEDRNKTPNNRLSELEKVGVIECNQWIGKVGGKGDRYWSLPELTMKKILDSGKRINKDFEHHLRSALDFFSKYYLFGEVGTFLLDRMCNDTISPFRFKHEYFMQSLNDFNIIDLLYAIENNKWCMIKYKHGIADVEVNILCYPLELRVSSMQGREFLIFYEPFRRSYTALRIEFIDALDFYDDIKIKAVLSQTGYHLQPETIDADISNARESIKYSWGVSTTRKQEGNAVNIVEPHPVSFQIEYTPDTEYYIVNRLNRECRFGVVTSLSESNCLNFTIDVTDEVELRPWIRSFYSRIKSCEGMDTESHFLEDDVERVVGLLVRDKLRSPDVNTQFKQPTKWEIPPEVVSKLGKGTKAREHEFLFNELFSIYYYIMADVFVHLCLGDEKKLFSESEIEEIIKLSFKKFSGRMGKETIRILRKEIKELFLFGGFLEPVSRVVEDKKETGHSRKTITNNVYRPKYKCEQNVDLYRDVVPLSTFEQRWLLEIINDSKFQLFFSKEEIAELRKLLEHLGQKVSPLPMDKVIYYDRFHFSETNTKREAEVLAVLLEGIYDKRTVHIKYHTGKNDVIENLFNPIILEFSKRNNRFQAYLQECESGRIYTMNVSGIESVVETHDTFDYDTALRVLERFREENQTSVEVEFYNVRNMADRILTEFSPWKKQCTFDSETEVYRLKVFYQKHDEIDLVIRLMSYGANLHFVNKEHPIYKEILRRMNKQIDLIREGRRNKDEREGAR